MAESVVANKKVLAISLLMGVVAVVLFYVYDGVQRKKVAGDVVDVLAWKRDLVRGAEIAPDDISFPQVRRSLKEELNLATKASDLTLVTGGRHVSRDVFRGDFVRFNDILETQTGSPSRGINVGMRAMPLRVDPNYTVGELMRPDDRVDVMGLVAVGSKPAKAYTLIENLRVLSVGGRSPNLDEPVGPDKGRRSDPGMRVYRSVSVEVKQETAEQFLDLLARVRGKLWLVVRKPTDTKMRWPGSANQGHGNINPELIPVLSQPIPEDLDT